MGSISLSIIIGALSSLVATVVINLLSMWKDHARFHMAEGKYIGFAFDNDNAKPLLQKKEPQSNAEVSHKGRNILQIKVKHDGREWNGDIVMEHETSGTVVWRYMDLPDEKHEFGFKRVLIRNEGDKVLLYLTEENLLGEKRFGREVFVRYKAQSRWRKILGKAGLKVNPNQTPQPDPIARPSHIPLVQNEAPSLDLSRPQKQSTRVEHVNILAPSTTFLSVALALLVFILNSSQPEIIRSLGFLATLAALLAVTNSIAEIAQSTGFRISLWLLLLGVYALFSAVVLWRIPELFEFLSRLSTTAVPPSPPYP